MTKTYKRISCEERYFIEKMLKNGVSKATISQQLNRSKSSISNEVKRCCLGGYNYLSATHGSVSKSSNRKSGKTKMSTHKTLSDFVLSKLNLHWSPEQIHLNLNKLFPQNKAMNISIETI